MKQRFSSLDVKVISHELNESLCSLRLSNAYDLSSRIFLFKFAKPNVRQQLIIDSGFRCHLTKFSRTTASEPSAFVARLRKFLRTRRVTAVSQVGTDRVIEFTFGDGTYRLFLEFFAAGNVILTDGNLKILALLRVVPSSESQEELRVGLQYGLERRKNINGTPDITTERVLNGLKKASERAKSHAEGARKAKTSSNSLRKALATSLDELPPALIEHALSLKNLRLDYTIDEVREDPALLDQIVASLREAKDSVDRVLSGKEVKGYIAARPAKTGNGAKESTEQDEEVDKENVALAYEEFHPFCPHQFVSRPDFQILDFNGFNATVDEFFSSLESQKLEARIHERRAQATNKLEAARTEHDKRLEGLQQVQELNVRKAQAIESNIQRVEEATAAINGLIAQGMDWEEINQLIEMEQSRQNAVAKTIQLPLKLNANTATLLLAEPDFEDDGYFEGDVTESEGSASEDDESEVSKTRRKNVQDSRLGIDIDLSLTPWANAREYYGEKKSAAIKEKKTLDSSEKALKSQEQRVLAGLKKGLQKEADALRPIRNQLWFEKFFYFITSEGYLVIGGRDDRQIDVLFQRYFQKDDVWVHADIKGAVPFIVKNRPGFSNRPVPPNSLAQAGALAVATSTAWESKAVMAAWWVGVEQVHKMDSTGHYLDAGSFVITGEKTYLPPAQLLLGLGVMFRISPESKARHFKHRIDSDQAPVATSQSSTDDHKPGNTDSKRAALQPIQDEPIAENNKDRGEGEDENTASEASNSNVASDEETANVFQNPLQPSQDEAQSISQPMVDLSLEHHNVGEETNQGSAAVSTEPSTTSATADTPKPKNLPQVRGKKSKLAKAKANKYAEQDAEEKELAMRLLGAGPSSSKEATNASGSNSATKEAEAAAQKERRRLQHVKDLSANKAADESRWAAIKSGVDLLSHEETAELKLVEDFVGTPLPGDEILDALVVCGSWDALGPRLRWKVKMQPGTQKRGKALQEILKVWTRDIEAREKKRLPAEGDPEREQELLLRKEGELVKNIRDAETIGMIPVGKIRLVMAGGSTKGGGKEKGGGQGGGGKGGKSKGDGKAGKGKGKKR